MEYGNQGAGSKMVAVALLAWVPFTVFLFLALRPRHALIVCVVGGWMFLPTGQITVPISGIPDFTRFTAVAVSGLGGAILVDWRRLMRFQPHWLDCPVLILCAVAFASSLSNGLGLFDAFASLWDRLVTWGIPYFLGRIYFQDAEAMRDLAIGVFVGSLIYAPLALFEVRMSPQLHNWIYGYSPSSMAVNRRFGGFRPMVFMQTGLMLGFFFAAGSVTGAWMYVTGALRRLWGLPLLLPVIGLGITTVLAKAVGAIALMVAGFGALWSIRALRLRLAILLLLLVPIFYVGARSTESWSGKHLVDAASLIQESRAQSIAFRFRHESELSEKAWQRPLLGWGGWGRNRIKNEQGEDVSITDGLWIITFGSYGLIGLCSLIAVLLLPSALLLLRCSRAWWSDPRTSPAAALAIIPILFAIDSLLNAMLNPVWIVIVGALGSYYIAVGREGAREPQGTSVRRDRFGGHRGARASRSRGCRVRPA